MSALQITAITLIAVASLVGVALFARTVGYLVRVVRLGAPDPTRGGQAGGHARSSGRRGVYPPDSSERSR